MSDKVVTLSGQPAPQSGTPRPATIAMLEDLLEKAKAGELQGFAGAYLWKDGSATWCLSGLVGGFGMIGALDIVKHHLIEQDAAEDGF